MLSNRQLTEIALSGRWIKAGSMWLDQNAPCTVRQAIEGITSIMPFTIRTKGRKIESRPGLAKLAVFRYCGGLKKDLDFVIQKKGSESTGKTIQSLVLEEIKAGGPAEGADFLITHANARLHALRQMGLLLKLGRVYYIEGQDPAMYVKRPRSIATRNN